MVDSKTVNAFAAPGGYIVVFRGLIDHAAGADGLAGVMAHEMGHVIERHGMEGLVKALGLSFVMGALIGDTSGFAGIAADMAQRLATSKFSRDAEREADRIAVEMLNRTGISGRGFQAFFQTMARKAGAEEGSIGRYFASHPATGGRAQFRQGSCDRRRPRHVRRRMAGHPPHVRSVGRGAPTPPADTPERQPACRRAGRAIRRRA